MSVNWEARSKEELIQEIKLLERINKAKDVQVCDLVDRMTKLEEVIECMENDTKSRE